jgi:uncharacterized membrane protein
MSTNRLEAFSDGVIAIIITIMVLEFEVPEGHEFADIKPLWPTLASYALSFVFVANYWNNHHHLLQAASRVNAKVMWANAHLLFWLSLTPFATAWLGHNATYPLPVAMYGVLQLACGFAFLLLTRALLREEDNSSFLSTVIGAGRKEKTSVALYAISIPLAYLHVWLSFAAFIIVAVMWLVPDRRYGKIIKSDVTKNHDH